MEISSNQRITPFLWFDTQAEEAINFYVSLFNNSKILGLQRMAKDGPVLTGTFQLEGLEIMALNAGPMYQFTPAISFFVKCKDQQEVDDLWNKFSENGGTPQPCGWITDKFGLSWQIIPNALSELMFTSDAARSQRVMQAMLKMQKIEVSKLQEAYNG